jgi:hypothetical protein
VRELRALLQGSLIWSALVHVSEAGREVLAGVLICPKKRLTAVEEALEQTWSSFKEPFGS